jgi:2-methylcitrate dehydratase PrpD
MSALLSSLVAATTASQRIAEFACHFDASSMPQTVRTLCARSLVDTFAVGIGGANEPAALSARALAEADRRTAGTPATARVWAGGLPTHCEIAALANGILAHVLDYDDVTPALRGHPSVVLWPALLALGEAFDLPGDDLEAAFVIGFEVMCMLARAIGVPHYEKGWHSTASIGVLGATVACTRLLRLDVPRTVNAIGLAVAQAAGCRANVGTQAKCFQAGQAAAAAVRAARLAQAGLESSPDSLDGNEGYARLYADNLPLEPWLSELGSGLLEIERSGIDVKQYPMCYATHRALDAVLALRHEHGIRFEDVERVHVHSSHGGLLPLTHHRPATGLEGKFSIEYAMAAALKDGVITLDTFTDRAVMRAEIQSFMPAVETSSAIGERSPRWAHVTVTLKNGREVERRVEVLRGSSTAPLSDDELIAKAGDCLRFGGSSLAARTLFEIAVSMRSNTVRALLDALQADGR